MSDVDEYLLALAFFIETFAATIFSLFDVSGSLINQLYKLNINEDDVSFHKALVQLQQQGGIAPNDDVFRLLCSYSFSSRVTGYTNTVPLYNITWLEPIKEIRNRTTHRPITDVCDFVREVFDGIEEFVEDLYFYLREAVQRSTSLPIY